MFKRNKVIIHYNNLDNFTIGLSLVSLIFKDKLNVFFFEKLKTNIL